MAPYMFLIHGITVFKNLPKMASQSKCGDSMVSQCPMYQNRRGPSGDRAALQSTHRGTFSLPIPATSALLFSMRMAITLQNLAQEDSTLANSMSLLAWPWQMMELST